MVSWKGIYFVVALFLGSFFGSIFMLGPFLPLMFISPAWYRWITDCIVATWLTLPVALLEMVFGAKVVVTGDGFVPGERSVIIMNHRTRMDWMFLWNCLLRYSYLRLEKICLKSSLKSIPGFGWAMQVAAFVFIQRKWEDDKSHFEQMLDYFCDIREPLQLLIFPEGTDLTGNVMYFGNAKNVLFKALNKISTAEPKTKEEACSILEDQGHVLGNPQQDLSLANPSNAGLRVPVWVPLVDAEVTDSSHDPCDQTEANTKARSNEFAEKNGLQKYEYVLHPRTTGFTFVVERLREGDNLDAIHDITVAYPQNIPQTEKHLLYGKFPKEIHFHVQRYPIETVPASKEELQLWCRKRWEEKEERLRRFYEGGRCFGGAGQGVVPPCKSELRVLAVKCASLLYWMLFPPGVLALLYLYSLARWYFAAMVVFFVVQQKVFGGLELIELACHRYFKKQQKFHETKIKSN